VQLSIVCSNSTAGDEALQAAASALFQCGNRESDVTDSNGKPKLLWSLFYVQTTSNPREGSTDKGSCGMPDGTLDYKTMMALTEIYGLIQSKISYQEQWWLQTMWRIEKQMMLMV